MRCCSLRLELLDKKGAELNKGVRLDLTPEFNDLNSIYVAKRERHRKREREHIFFFRPTAPPHFCCGNAAGVIQPGASSAGKLTAAPASDESFVCLRCLLF